ncbi:LEM domain containing 2, partial [Pristimantis euphronides]
MEDDRLRRELTALGYTPGPITDNTRKVLQKKLDSLRAQTKNTRSRGQHQPPPEGAPWPDKRAQQQESTRDSRTCQGRERAHLPGDSLRRSSSGHYRSAGDSPERSSLGHTRYSDDNPRRSSSGQTIHADSLIPPSLQQEKASRLRPCWSKKLERSLSVLLRVLCVLLLLVFTGILIVKCGLLTVSQDGVKLLPSDCEDRNDLFCKAKQKEITLQILSELYEFLSLEAGNFECGNPSDLRSKCIPFTQAKEYVMNVTGNSAEKFDAAVDWMLSSNHHLGIW